MEYILQEVISKIKDKSISYNIFRIHSDDSVICGFHCIAFIEYIIERKTLSDYTNLFSSNDYKTNGKIIHKYFKEEYDKRKRNP